MPNASKGEFQTIRLTKIPVETVRKIKSEAALIGVTQDEYLTEFLIHEFENEAAQDETP
jgi:hypothetical protein